jgi:hypothetical protein
MRARDVAGQLLDPLLQPCKLFDEWISLIPAALWGIGCEYAARHLIEAPFKIIQPQL